MIEEEARPGVQSRDRVHIIRRQCKVKCVGFDFDVGCRKDDKTILADYWTILQKRLR